MDRWLSSGDRQVSTGRTASDDTNYTTGASGMNASLRIEAKHAATVAINNWLLSLFLGMTGSAS